MKKSIIPFSLGFICCALLSTVVIYRGHVRGLVLDGAVDVRSLYKVMIENKGDIPRDVLKFKLCDKFEALKLNTELPLAPGYYDPHIMENIEAMCKGFSAFKPIQS
ncbi:MAG: hypothetical protein V2I33_15720 [Kangiellaceae bacterium]|jgi:hypothetical protein|nr:hypothetical protein [Kangiellaceae bacterium]